MNKLLLLAVGLACSVTVYCQTTLFSDNFEAGSGSWTLNGGSGSNQWLVNNVYAGLNGFINDTPSQPGAIGGSPFSNYLHITNNSICGVGICNSNFDTGSSSNQTAQLTNSIDATGYNNVTLSFYYLCAGATNVSYGTVEYSTDGGVSWTPTGTNYVNTTTWTQATVSLPAWNNVANLKFRFRWQNGASGNDPAFSVDEVTVSGIGGSFATITTGTINASGWCFGTSTNVQVGFTVTGTVNAGNVYTAQLSNAAGSFASPVAIGTLTSAATGTLSINATIPAGTPAGAGYRIRVIASDPATTGSDNGNNLTVHPQPTITVVGNPADGTICEGSSITLLATGGVSYSWSPSGSIDQPTQAQVVATPATTTTYAVIGTDVNGCTNTAMFLVTVEDCAGINEQTIGFRLYPNPASESITVQPTTTLNMHSVELLNLNGQRVRLLPLAATIGISDLAPGTYFVRITHDYGTSMVRFNKQ